MEFTVKQNPVRIENVGILIHNLFNVKLK
jgi:hypothetical protein